GRPGRPSWSGSRGRCRGRRTRARARGIAIRGPEELDRRGRRDHRAHTGPGQPACKRMAVPTEVNLEHPAGAGSPEILDGHMLALYLRDHHALLVALGELASRMNTPARSDDQQAFAAQLGRAASADRASVEELLRRLDSAPSQIRHAAAWSFEKVGRLKLNGRIVRPSPLAAVTELEGCKILLESDRALWSGLAHLAIGPADSGERARRAEELLAEAVGLRVDAFHGATHHRVDAVGQPR